MIIVCCGTNPDIAIGGFDGEILVSEKDRAGKLMSDASVFSDNGKDPTNCATGSWVKLLVGILLILI